MAVIMGLDPGMARTGYGLLEVSGSNYRVVAYDCIHTPAASPEAARLEILYRELTALLERYRPQDVAVEQLFINRNTSTVVPVGQARGVALLAARQAGAAVVEYTPSQVKLGLTGAGRAGKKQVQYMVRTILGLTETLRPDDVADALAVAICHCHHRGWRRFNG
ncbi:MAG: crossover junction endodeoxyribonuclease RuvC [Candidatus Desulforudis sp.]|nr:crossover junction endodeoxyribonuclease RuvC [Desulforudis sp.]